MRTPARSQESHPSARQQVRLLYLADGTPRPLRFDDPAYSEADSRPREIGFSRLDNGVLLDLLEDPEDPSQTMLAVYDSGKIDIVRSWTYGRRTFKPLRRVGPILPHVRLPQGVRPYGSIVAPFAQLMKLMGLCVAIPVDYRILLSAFVLSTWVVDRLSTAPYVLVVGPPQSGKSTLLHLLGLVCRRALLVDDITTAAFYEACDRVTPTMLIDEVGSHPGQSVNRLRHLLRTGSTPDALGMRYNRTRSTFGAKVIASLEPPQDEALNSRCILIRMTENNLTKLRKPSDPEIQHRARELQKALLQFRFDRYDQIKPVTPPGAEELRPRRRDLVTSLAAPFEGATVDVNGRRISPVDMVVASLRGHDATRREVLPVPESAVLTASYLLIHSSPSLPSIIIGNLAKEANRILRGAGETFALEARKVGEILTWLGFPFHRRSNSGYYVLVDQSTREKIHQLVQTYKDDCRRMGNIAFEHEACEICYRLASDPT